METMIQPKITGYRQLSEGEVVMMNEGKALAELCGEYVKKLRNQPGQQSVDPQPVFTVDQRWVSIGATDLQTGFMSLMRAISQPTTF